MSAPDATHTGRESLHCRGIFRELAHSPGRETDDALILRETAQHLEAAGFSVALQSAEELSEETPFGSDETPPLLFVMCEQVDILETLERWEARGACVVNSASGIRNTYRDRTAALFEASGVAFPRSILVGASGPAPRSPAGSDDLTGLWIKRGDVHATEAADVVRARDTPHALAILADFARRGVSHALLQEHVEGDLIKFYGVGGGAVTPGSELTEEPWFEWFYHRDQVLHRHPFDRRVLAAAAREAAAALGLEVWGGDVIVGPDGHPVVIDLNAWPSFALYRETAGARIAAHLGSRFRRHVETSRMGVAE